MKVNLFDKNWSNLASLTNLVLNIKLFSLFKYVNFSKCSKDGLSVTKEIYSIDQV